MKKKIPSGCSGIKLGRRWGKRKSGSVVYADPIRAAALRAGGYLEEPPAPKAKPAAAAEDDDAR